MNLHVHTDTRRAGGADSRTADIHAQVDAARLATLYQMTAVPVIAGLLFCALPVIALWPFLSHGVLLGWLACRLSLGGLRCIDLLLFSRARPGLGQSRPWWRRYYLLLALDSLTWGAMGWLFHAPQVPDLDGMLVAAMVGMGAVGLFSLGSVWRAHLVFSVLTFAPLVLYHLSAPGLVNLAVAMGLLMFLGFAMFESRRAEARSTELLRLRFENAWIAEERQQALQSAERNSSSKSRFVAVMSHEIRTPLNGILGMTQLLERSTLDAQQREQVDIVGRSGRHLLTLVNDILDLSRIESGKLAVHTGPVLLRETVGEVWRLLAGSAHDKGLNFELNLSPTLPACVLGDAKRIKQVLHNLIGNAIKFTEQGRVALDVNTLLDRRAGTLLRFAVQDTGEGIAADQTERMFAPYEQASQDGGAAAQRHDGTGLGLTISRELARAMGGELRCNSVPGRGSVFEFSLPLQVCAAIDSRPITALTELPQLCGRVLLVDDSQVNLLVASSMLEACGLNVDQAENGMQALERLKAVDYDLVLMDCQMPELNGFAATQSWRAHERRQGLPRLPIVALTASAVDSDRERCLAAGMDDYLTKPFELADLTTLVQRHLRRAVMA